MTKEFFSNYRQGFFRHQGFRLDFIYPFLPAILNLAKIEGLCD
jgi:hypothetical protein